MTPLVSCVMLTQFPKRQRMMQQAIQSFLMQDYPHKELVIVNDGGQYLEMPCENMRVVNCTSRLSIGEKRNVGTAWSYGEWIATWDDDDFSFPERLSVLMRRAQQTGAQYVRCIGLWLADENLRIVGKVSHDAYGTAIVHRDALERVGGYPATSWLEDMELYVRLALRGIRRETVRDLLYVYRRHGLNVSAERQNDVDAKLRLADPTGADEANARLRELLGLEEP